MFDYVSSLRTFKEFVVKVGCIWTTSVEIWTIVMVQVTCTLKSNTVTFKTIIKSRVTNIKIYIYILNIILLYLIFGWNFTPLLMYSEWVSSSVNFYRKCAGVQMTVSGGISSVDMTWTELKVTTLKFLLFHWMNIHRYNF